MILQSDFYHFLEKKPDLCQFSEKSESFVHYYLAKLKLSIHSQQGM